MLENPYENLEIVVGDDCSTDSTAKEISKFSENPRVRLFFSPANIGAGALRNRLLEMATGEFIALQDGDDLCRADRFVRQMEVMNLEKCDVVGTAAQLIDSQGRSWGAILPPEKPKVLSWWLQRAVVHASVLIRRSSLKSAKYHPSLGLGEDYYFLTQLYLSGAKFRNLTETIYFYYVEPSKLKKWDRRKWTQIVNAKWEISKLFPFYKGIPFFLLNLTMMTLSYFRQRLT